ncbi:MAG: hypothetical protein E6H83_07515 [Chloroflexi bacterium]|nr:MAG: hypothetical protein E6H83_07515 [Chloroflexota bacterium]
MRLWGTPRAAGAWGIAFVVLLLVSAAMISLPTALDSGVAIAAFYSAHAQLIVIQQIVGIAALAAFVTFALSLPPRRSLRIALWAFVACELITNLVPLIIVAANLSPDAAHTLTLVEDVADSALFLSVGFFVSAVTLSEPLWLRIASYVVAAACGIRAIASPLGTTALDQVAPLLFVAFVLVLSVKLLVGSRQAVAAAPTR